MALRVLLADESMPMRKVMQLALQDFAVEVSAVQSGPEVVEVARQFKPDIIFIDVILPRKSGYEVSHQLKSDKTLNSVPVVLMWSSLLSLDQAQFAKSKANAELAKPFDTETLRNLVKELVPKTQTNRLAHFLQFPAEFVEPLEAEERQKAAKKAPPPLKPSAPASAPTPPALSMQPETNPQATSNWNMENFDPMPDVMSHFKEDTVEQEPMKFAKLGGGGTKTTVQAPPQTPNKEEGDPWAHQDLNRFKLDIPEGDVDQDEISIVFDMDEAEPQGDDFLLKRGSETTKSSAKIALPKLDEVTQDFPMEHHDEVMEHTQHQIQPIGEIKDIDGGLISQFETQEEDVPLKLSLEEAPETHPVPSAAAGGIEFPNFEIQPDTSVPQMDADQLEKVIRAQSRDVIEAVVQRVVPEIAREMIKKELDRLLRESR